MLLSSSNRKYPPLPLLSYFSVVVCMRCLLHLILSRIAYAFRENWEFVYIIIVHFRMSANSRIRFGLRILFVCLDSTPSYYHHCANLSVSEDIELIKRLSDIFLSIVWLRYSIFSQLSIIQYAGLCAFSLPIKPCDVWEYVYALSYYHNQIGSMSFYPLFRVRSWNNVTRCMSLYILTIDYLCYLIPEGIPKVIGLFWHGKVAKGYDDNADTITDDYI